MNAKVWTAGLSPRSLPTRIPLDLTRVIGYTV